MATGEDWTDAELRASVRSYLDMAARLRSGQQVVKSHEYRRLAETYGRTVKAWERRAQNISRVLQLHGRDWIPGLLPAKNVGSAVAVRLEKILAAEERRAARVDVGFSIEVQNARRKKRSAVPPPGQRTPARSTAPQTVYSRDAKVRAWVLEEATGLCECCGEKAPFISFDGEPFLEVHHVRPLVDEGSDTVTNAVAICPNCHRALHHARDKDALREHLYLRVARLVRE